MLPFFVEFWRWKYFFLNIPSYPPPFAVRNSLTNKFYQQNWGFWIFKKKRKKVTSFSGTLLYTGSRENLSLFLFFWKYPETSTFLVKLIGQWIPGNKGRSITRDILNIHINFQHSAKNWNKDGTIYKTEMLHFQIGKLSHLCFHFL